jgi:DNA topoisomerase-2
VSNAYKLFSLYILAHRAIPNLLDGLKTSQRKALWVSKSRARNFVKTEALAGYVYAEGNYHHGPASLSQAMSMMARDFQGANNIPLMDGDGAFGSFLDPTGYGSPRYTGVRVSKWFDLLFDARDFEIAPTAVDPEDPEPEHFLPILPVALLNGVSGVAVAYATEICAYDPMDILNRVEDLLAGKKPRKRLIPWYKGYTGEVTLGEEGKFQMTGKMETVGRNKVKVTEVPIQYSQEKYIALLGKLLDKGKIDSWVDMSKEHWDITIKLNDASPTGEELEKALGLRVSLPENINFIENGQIIGFDTADEYIEKWFEKRLPFFQARKENEIRKVDEHRLNVASKLALNAVLTEHGGKLSGLSGEECGRATLKLTNITALTKVKVQDIALAVPVTFKTVQLSAIGDDKVKDLQEKAVQLNKVREELVARSITEDWKNDIQRFRTEYKKRMA